MNFKFSGTQKIDDSGKGSFIYKGVDLMEYQYQWEPFTNNFPRLVLVVDKNGTVFKPAIYRLTIKEETLLFASGEITNGVWGFALPDK